ncbi:MAG: aspartate--tRNA ligase [Candidatus Dormibacteraeota bacterium]|uniref:Aspartate--tRNA(Asp/Asn) ligase n=2 Tax=Candidatus Aeolococcaceae TaxID=3127005 RepID=A0A934K0J4_9BACT|nr:aspartate--tRNA ligase [Candidatus Dormibacteraeota bacterium]MBJ7610237.1 aspartate--tRNA ligase [Candidatus Dormibacteraeota bacterium]
MTVERTGCGLPRAADAGETMTIFGWVDRRRDHGGLIFLDLRDHTGILQVVINPQTAAAAHQAAHAVRLEYVLRVRGQLRTRDPHNVNPRRDTGEVEMYADECQVLSIARTPPFPINEDTEVEEALRLRHRYLDLRRPRLQRNLRSRARFISHLRSVMGEMGFTEIETPMMIRATPEGARDYLVPSRLQPGSFYALPQSPQLYKQLCMVAGLDRYFQIARCMRDEDLRADRQPEFTQLDIEMSFVDEEDVFAVLERAISSAWSASGFRGTIVTPFPRLTWHQAMDRYGVDKPDVRFGMELRDLTDAVRGSSFRVFADAVAGGGVVKGIAVPGGADLSRSDIEGRLTEVVRTFRARGLAYLWHRQDGWQGGIAKFFSEAELAAIGEIAGAAVGDAVLMVADRPPVVAASLGALRNQLARERAMADPEKMAMIWVTEFPMFERDQETGEVTPLHHPFTMLHADDVDLLESEPLRIRSRAYDIVLNGRELGSGSIRITDPAIQERVFAVMGIDAQTAEGKFGFLLEAFQYGVPPHGGFAAGIERLVMEGLGEENIRDVLAFPKNQQAQEPMTGAPAPVDVAQLAELGLTVSPTPPATQT